MEKNFEDWSNKKKQLHENKGTALFHEREVWWGTLGMNVGFEQDGNSDLFTRPVVILTKFNLDVCLIVPLTARPKQGKYYFSVGEVEGRSAVAVLSQIRLIDRKRLALKMTTLPEAVFEELTKKVVDACFPNLKA